MLFEAGGALFKTKVTCRHEILVWVRTALLNKNSRTFQGQVFILQGLKMTEVQGSAIFGWIHICPLNKTHITAG